MPNTQQLAGLNQVMSDANKEHVIGRYFTKILRTQMRALTGLFGSRCLVSLFSNKNTTKMLPKERNIQYYE